MLLHRISVVAVLLAVASSGCLSSAPQAPPIESAAPTSAGCEAVEWSFPEEPRLAAALRAQSEDACRAIMLHATLTMVGADDGTGPADGILALNAEFPLIKTPILIPHPGSDRTIEGSTTPRDWVPFMVAPARALPCIEPWTEPLAEGAPPAPEGGYHAKPCEHAKAEEKALARITQRARVLVEAEDGERVVFSRYLEPPAFDNGTLSHTLKDLRQEIAKNGTSAGEAIFHVKMYLSEDMNEPILAVTTASSMSYRGDGVALDFNRS